MPYEVLNKKFRTTQKILDREATYVCQANTELEKFFRQFELPSGSGSSSHEGEPGSAHTPTGSEFLVSKTLEGSSSDGPLLVESSINVQQIAALLASVKEDGRDEPMLLDNRHGRPLQKAHSLGSDAMDSEDSHRRSSDVEGLLMLGGDSSKSEQSSGSRKSAKDVERLLDVLVDRLGSLKRKAEESIQEELQAADNVRKRVQHLKSFLKQMEESAQTDDEDAQLAVQKNWKKSRLNRMLIDHLLREGMYDTARRLSEDLDIMELTNVDVRRVK